MRVRSYLGWFCAGLLLSPPLQFQIIIPKHLKTLFCVDSQSCSRPLPALGPSERCFARLCELQGQRSLRPAYPEFLSSTRALKVTLSSPLLQRCCSTERFVTATWSSTPNNHRYYESSPETFGTPYPHALPRCCERSANEAYLTACFPVCVCARVL